MAELDPGLIIRRRLEELRGADETLGTEQNFSPSVATVQAGCPGAFWWVLNAASHERFTIP
jgi:hypothetical protein